MTALAIIALLSISDASSSPASTNCDCTSSTFANPLFATLGADGGLFNYTSSDAGSIGTNLGAIHAGQISGSSGPTCGAYVYASGAPVNPFDGGASCSASSTDMSGTITGATNVLAAIGTAGGTAMIYVQPGTPYSTTTKCGVRTGDGDGGSFVFNATMVYVVMDAGANAMQIVLADGATNTLPVGVFTFDYLCVGP